MIGRPKHIELETLSGITISKPSQPIIGWCLAISWEAKYFHAPGPSGTKLAFENGIIREQYFASHSHFRVS